MPSIHLLLGEMGEYLQESKNENRAYHKNSVEVNEKKERKKEGLGRKGIKGDWRAMCIDDSFEIRIAKGKRGRSHPGCTRNELAIHRASEAAGQTLLLSISRWMNWIWRQPSVSDATVSVIDSPFCIGAEITCEPIEAVVRKAVSKPVPSFFPLPRRSLNFSSLSIEILFFFFPIENEFSALYLLQTRNKLIEKLVREWKSRFINLNHPRWEKYSPGRRYRIEMNEGKLLQ